MLIGSSPVLESPCWIATTRLPPAVAGALAPSVAGAALAPPSVVDEPSPSPSLPQAAITAPMNGTDRPMIVPRRTKSRRFTLPCA